MTWDGIPEHRNLHGDDTPGQGESRAERIARMFAGSGGTPESPLPPDPFSGTHTGAVAQAEMFRSLTTEGGLTEPQALYYLACLVQVGLAMRMGQFGGTLPPWPEQ